MVDCDKIQLKLRTLAFRSRGLEYQSISSKGSGFLASLKKTTAMLFTRSQYPIQVSSNSIFHLLGPVFSWSSVILGLPFSVWRLESDPDHDDSAEQVILVGTCIKLITRRRSPTTTCFTVCFTCILRLEGWNWLIKGKTIIKVGNHWISVSFMQDVSESRSGLKPD